MQRRRRRTHQRRIHVEIHELRNLVQRRAHPVVVQVEIVIGLGEADIDVHPLDRLVGWIVDAVRVAHAVGGTGGRLQRGGAAVDGELGVVAVQDHEHLFTGIVEMLADAAMGLDDAAMQEDQVGGKRLSAEQGAELHRPGAFMHAGGALHPAGVVMADPGRERAGGGAHLGHGRGRCQQGGGGGGKGEASADHGSPNFSSHHYYAYFLGADGSTATTCVMTLPPRITQVSVPET